MERDPGSTRRQFVKASTGLAVGGALAGCADDSNTGTEDETYSVTMSPVGEVSFDSPPESAVAFDNQWIDHMVALGQADKVAGLARPDGYFTEYYEQLSGVSLDTDTIEKIWGGDSIDKEVLYSIDADVHHIDPIRSTQNLGFDKADVEEVEAQIGPYFANRYSRSHNAPESASDYQYYTLWELAEKFAEVYQTPGRIERLKDIRDEMVAEIEENLPPENQRPTVGLVVFWTQDEKWYPYRISQAGFGRSQYQHLGLNDAFDDSDKTYNASYDAAYDHEGMLDIDPDILIQNFGLTYPDSGDGSMRELYDMVNDDAVASELTAVQNDRFYPGGTAFQGPLFNLFQIEIAAKQIYPNQFGEFRGVGNTPESEQLFDRQRVADIINGNF